MSLCRLTVRAIPKTRASLGVAMSSSSPVTAMSVRLASTKASANLASLSAFPKHKVAQLTTLQAIQPSFWNAVAQPVRFMSVDKDSDPQFHAQPKNPAASVTSPESEEMQDMQRQIKEVVTSNKIVLFMKGTPDHPQCGFSSRVVQLLGRLNISYESCNVLENPLLREGIKQYSDWPTIPQLYVDGEFIGGCDIVTSMFTSGELHELVGVPKPAPAVPVTETNKE